MYTKSCNDTYIYILNGNTQKHYALILLRFVNLDIVKTTHSIKLWTINTIIPIKRDYENYKFGN